MTTPYIDPNIIFAENALVQVKNEFDRIKVG